ncbi:hypothetical protein MFU01_02170 [Myxococcus fulvus]|uniref:Uncharacterized protein n=1 Tax=Myxococcus fulvus TaxID=33 RepID=A0A511STD4_MYXFU|nr:hypothetical protein MFU01_02170 [Myxococcus fulvus]
MGTSLRGSARARKVARTMDPSGFSDMLPTEPTPVEASLLGGLVQVELERVDEDASGEDDGEQDDGGGDEEGGGHGGLRRLRSMHAQSDVPLFLL